MPEMNKQDLVRVGCKESWRGKDDSKSSMSTGCLEKQEQQAVLAEVGGGGGESSFIHTEHEGVARNATQRHHSSSFKSHPPV